MTTISDAQFQRCIEDLGRFVSIPSVSNPENEDYSVEALREAAEFVESGLEDLNFKTQLLSVNNSAPYLVAKRVLDASYPILVLYSHYDVQPVEREKWTSDPFVMKERDGRLYGRGASDDKAGVIAIIYALSVLQETDRTLPLNITVFLEGEEEDGSPNMSDFLKEHAAKVAGDALVVLDVINRTVDTGSLTSSTRGLANITLKVKALEKAMHSGVYGLAPDPAIALASLIATLANPREIPGFMEGATALKQEERRLLKESSISHEEYAQESTMLPQGNLRMDPSKSIYEAITEEPNLSIVSMVAGERGGAGKIQADAEAKISARILPGQDPDRVAEAISAYIRSQRVLFNLTIEIEKKECAPAWKGKVTGPLSTKYMEAMQQHFKETCAMPCGGALPLLSIFEQHFPNMEMILPGVEDPKTSAHGDDESQDIGLLRRVINSLITFFEKVADEQS